MENPINILVKKYLSELNEIPNDLNYVLIGAALSGLGLLVEFQKICESYLKVDSVEAKVKRVMKMRECLMRGTVLCGAPKMINAATVLKDTITPEVLEKLPKDPIRKAVSLEEHSNYEILGHTTFELIYGKHTQRVKNILNDGYPDLYDFIMKDIYGKVLSNTEHLSLIENELVCIVYLGISKVPKQLKSHCLATSNLGVSLELIEKINMMTSQLFELYVTRISESV